MIVVIAGNPGASKTSWGVRNMFLEDNRPTLSNIKTINMKHTRMIDPSMIVKRQHERDIIHRDKSVTPVYKHSLNIEFWKELEKPVNIYLDEVHTWFSSRSSMSKVNRLMADWLALIRKMLGSEEGEGDAYFMSQLVGRADVILREMAQRIQYHRCHWLRICKHCGHYEELCNDDPERAIFCPRCKKHWGIRNRDYVDTGHKAEIWKFTSVYNYDTWRTSGMPTYYEHSYIYDLEKFFGFYDTYQWENLFEGLY